MPSLLLGDAYPDPTTHARAPTAATAPDTIAHEMPFLVQWLIAVGAAYLIGSIPFGFLIARARGIDIREHGSGNIGATNVRRVVGKGWGNLAFLLDVGKGAVPTLALGAWLGLLGHAALPPAHAFAFIAIAAATILGHMYPIYLRLRGGKGVATGFGALTALWPVVTPAAGVALATWIVVVRTSRYVSIASCAAAIALPLAVLVLSFVFGWPDPGAALEDRLAAWPFLLTTALLGAMVIFKHRGNLARLRAGTEPRIGTPLEHPPSRTDPASEDAENPAIQPPR